MKSSEWLARQLDDIRNKMETSSRALAEFQGSIGVADIEGDKSTYSEHMGELSRQFTQAESERIQLEALLKNVQGNADSLPEVRNNPVVQQLTQKLAEQRAELSQAKVVYGANHPVVQKLQSQVDELQSELGSQKHATVNSLRASYAAAEARERLMAAEMKGTTKELGQMARYTALKKEVQTDVDLYNSLYAKIKEAGIAAASKSANIHTVDPALVPDEPSRPRWVVNICVGLLAGIFGGVALAFVREELDNKLRSPEDIRQWIGNANVSIIPIIGESDGQETRLAWSKRIVGTLAVFSTTEDTRTNTFFPGETEFARRRSHAGVVCFGHALPIRPSASGLADCFSFPRRRQDHGGSQSVLRIGQAGQGLPGGCRPAQRQTGARFWRNFGMRFGRTS